MQDSIGNTRSLLLRFIDQWESKPHIQSRHLFSLYKERIQGGKPLTDPMVKHISSFIRSERNCPREQLLESLYELKHPNKPPPSTLDNFFT